MGIRWGSIGSMHLKIEMVDRLMPTSGNLVLTMLMTWLDLDYLPNIDVG